MHSDRATAAVQLNRVSKSYDLETSSTLSVRDILHPRKIVNRFTSRQPFWALTDVTIAIPHGQVLGIIGPNGSGKSSLLRILAGISPPTRGEVHIDGTYGALLELGAGFHPAVSGRENAYINALFMGMSKVGARAAMPAIIEFSGLGAFIDQPMRTYSSGMFLRLGFSVAIHVRPDILIVDEVLAVGDAAFQEKCFAHFRSLKERNTTVILVTHNIETLVDFADRVIMLEHGTIRHDGEPSDVVGKYMRLLVDADPAMRRAYERAAMGNIVEQALRDRLTGDEINALLRDQLDHDASASVRASTAL